MKKLLLLFTFVFGVSSSAWAAACPTATLAVYDAAGFSCNIGVITFGAFDYVPSGSVLIPDSDVAVTPETIGGEEGFQFNAPWFALPGEFMDSFIDYTATCTGCTIDDLVLAIAGASDGTGGLVNVTETSPALSGSLEVGAAGTTTILSDPATLFPPVGLAYGLQGYSARRRDQRTWLTGKFGHQLVLDQHLGGTRATLAASERGTPGFGAYRAAQIFALIPR